MPVPEASMHKHDRAVLREYQVWLSRQVFGVQLVTEPFRVEGMADHKLGLCMTAFDSSHVAASRLRIVDIRHDYAAFRWLRSLMSACMCGSIIRATSQKTGTATELPNCL